MDKAASARSGDNTSLSQLAVVIFQSDTQGDMVPHPDTAAPP